MAVDPFSPTFGTSPPLLVGRGEVIEEFGESLDSGPGAPGLATLLTGARGSGKTVLLNALEDEARSRGWRVVSETAHEGLVRRLIDDRLVPLWSEVTGAEDRPVELRSLSGFGFGATWERRDGEPARSPGLRPLLEAVTDELARHETGLLITVDEVHAATTRADCGDPARLPRGSSRRARRGGVAECRREPPP